MRQTTLRLIESIGAVRPPESECPERDECGPNEIVQMDSVISGEGEEGSVKAIGIEPNNGRADDDGHHCKQPPHGAGSLCGF
jgi:hypothetical protein